MRTRLRSLEQLMPFATAGNCSCRSGSRSLRDLTLEEDQWALWQVQKAVMKDEGGVRGNKTKTTKKLNRIDRVAQIYIA